MVSSVPPSQMMGLFGKRLRWLTYKTDFNTSFNLGKPKMRLSALLWMHNCNALKSIYFQTLISVFYSPSRR